MPTPDLDDVYREIKDDPYWDHLRLPGIAFVPGYGQRTRPSVMIVGEAPGATENHRQRPFCGPSGRVLDHLMDVAGLRLGARREDPPGHGDKTDPAPFTDPANAFVTNVVKYRPPGNRTPTINEIIHARDGFRPIGDVLYWAATSREMREQQRAQAERYASLSLAPGAGSLRREWQALGGPRLIVCVGSTAHAALHPASWERLGDLVSQPIPVKGKDGYWIVSQYHPAYGLRKGLRAQEMMTRHWGKLGAFMQEEGIL